MAFFFLKGRNSDGKNNQIMFHRAFLRETEEMSKKMCPRQNQRAKIEILGFTPPVYHEGKTCYVDFYYFEPVTKKTIRKKYNFDKIKGKRERREHVRLFVSKLTAKLIDGWRPMREYDTTNANSITIFESTQKYLARIENTGKKKTITGYNNFVKMFLAYLTKCQNPVTFVHELSTDIINDFLDYLIEKRGVIARTRNNYRSFLFSWCEWMIKRKYLSDNPVACIEKLKETDKIRKSLTASMLKTLFEHLNKSNPMFLLAVMMEYYTFIRPNELHYIKIGDINIEEQKIFVSKEHSKNKRDAYVALNKTVILQMIDCGIFDYPGDHYIFGRGLKPSNIKADYNIFNRLWDKTRTELGWGKEIKFYSLKDSGIRDLANSGGIVTARNQARHTDISTTNKYLETGGDLAPEEAKRFKGSL